MTRRILAAILSWLSPYPKRKPGWTNLMRGLD